MDKDADITIAARYMNDFQKDELSQFGILETDSEQRIIDFRRNL